MTINYGAVAIATVVAVIFSTIWYMALNGFRTTKRSGRPAVWKILVEVGRSGLFAFILAHVFVNLHVATVADSIRHDFWLWLAFPAILFFGLVVWEDMPWRDGLVHSGDWLGKLLLISIILTAGAGLAF